MHIIQIDLLCGPDALGLAWIGSPLVQMCFWHKTFPSVAFSTSWEHCIKSRQIISEIERSILWIIVSLSCDSCGLFLCERNSFCNGLICSKMQNRNWFIHKWCVLYLIFWSDSDVRPINMKCVCLFPVCVLFTSAKTWQWNSHGVNSVSHSLLVLNMRHLHVIN